MSTLAGGRRLDWFLGYLVDEGIRDEKLNFEGKKLFFLRLDGQVMGVECTVNPLLAEVTPDPFGLNYELQFMLDDSLTAVD
ncbi:hypothetical protein [Nocardia sp. NPDC057353]|uniref:hypothetical protein n=1 Tax=Nocardia sp. NPDC057353 TaxID=3346104 RepID=UPI003643FB5F